MRMLADSVHFARNIHMELKVPYAREDPIVWVYPNERTGHCKCELR